MTLKPLDSMNDYHQAWQNSVEQSARFWEGVAENFTWHQRWSNVQSGDFHDLQIKWFDGAKLNITENCLDRHVATHPHKTALIFEPNDPSAPALKLSYLELSERVNQAALTMRDFGVQKGDVVCFYMGMVPELLIGVLATARLGAIHSVVFGGFSAQALAGRIQDSNSKFVMASDFGLRGDKKIALKSVVDEALESCPSVEKVFVINRDQTSSSPKGSKDIDFELERKKRPVHMKAESVDAEHPLFILYTSGSTGRPKGLMHTTAGYMVQVAYSFANVFQIKEPSDVFWCTADIGWITGHSYLTYAPLLNGATTVMFEGVPTWPDGGRFWDIIDRHLVTHFYTAPTAIRALEALPIDLVQKRRLDSLKVLGSVGEPINEEAWQWYFDHIGKKKCPIVDTWWQTETGSILISPLANISPQKPGFATIPMPGADPLLVDPEGKEVKGNGVSGNLCLKNPWPSMARSIWGDHERFRETYFKTYPGLYFTGDGARRDEDGHYRITGRVDDVINVSGHRIGTAEVEEAINEHPAIIESAVVGFPHAIKGQGLFAYAIADGKERDHLELQKEINQVITKIIGPIAKIDHLIITSGLPKTRSGKIMRRILRKIAEGDTSSLGDTSTLLNPEIVDELKRKASEIL
jgi:acetyl-CoA synthetase